MDSFTHIALGACIGEVMVGKHLGKKALLIGALANSIPDIDVVANLWLNKSEGLLAHRGFTHSLLFAFIIAAPLALIFQKWLSRYAVKFKTWGLFFLVEIIVHIFIDAFNSYGTGWFEPFSHYRVAFNILFVADPFYSIWLLIAFFILIFIKRRNSFIKKWVKFGVGISTLYLFYCVINKIKVDADTKYILKKNNITYSRFFTTPAPLNNWLWYIVAQSDSGFYTGYYSVFQNKNDIRLNYFPQNSYLLKPMLHHKEVRDLLRFSKGYYIVKKDNDTLVFNDLRFGQIMGWDNPNNEYIFRYYLKYADNAWVMQRGRFSKWSFKAIKSLINRVFNY